MAIHATSGSVKPNVASNLCVLDNPVGVVPVRSVRPVKPLLPVVPLLRLARALCWLSKIIAVWLSFGPHEHVLKTLPVPMALWVKRNCWLLVYHRIVQSEATLHSPQCLPEAGSRLAAVDRGFVQKILDDAGRSLKSSIYPYPSFF